MDLNGAFGAYIFHQNEVEKAISSLLEGYEMGMNLEDFSTVQNICFNAGVNIANFSPKEIQIISRELEERINL